MKLRDLAKKGGVESIVGVIVLVGLVLLLIVVAVLPTINQTEESAGAQQSNMSTMDSMVNAGLSNKLGSLTIN